MSYREIVAANKPQIVTASRRNVAARVAVLAAVWAVIVTVTCVRGDGVAALYLTTLGATVVILSLELLRRAPG